MKIRLKKSLSLPLVAVALASTQALAADEGAKLSATGAVEARWYLLSSKTKASPYARTEELNVNLAINAVKDHTFAGVVFESLDNHHAKPDTDGVYSKRTSGEAVTLVNLYKYFVGVDFGMVKITAGNKQGSGIYTPDYQATSESTASKAAFYWFDDGFSEVEAPGITFEVPVSGWNIGVNFGALGDDGKTNAYGLTVKGEAGPAAIELSTTASKGAMKLDEATGKVPTTLVDNSGSRLAVSAPVGPVKVGLEYITTKDESAALAADGTKIGAYKKADGAETTETNQSWTALKVSGAQPMGTNSVVYSVDYKMASEDQKTAKMKYDLSGFGLDVGYKMADMYKGGSVTPGIKVKNSTQKADLPEANAADETTFADQSLQRIEVYGKYTYEAFTGSLAYRMDTAKGEVFEDASNSAKKTKKASSAFVRLAYNF
ncbi:MAG: hypothetical protein WCI18_09815 [Pseudomonadota bacterium]